MGSDEADELYCVHLAAPPTSSTAGQGNVRFVHYLNRIVFAGTRFACYVSRTSAATFRQGLGMRLRKNTWAGTKTIASVSAGITGVYRKLVLLKGKHEMASVTVQLRLYALGFLTAAAACPLVGTFPFSNRWRSSRWRPAFAAAACAMKSIGR